MNNHDEGTACLTELGCLTAFLALATLIAALATLIAAALIG